MNPSEKKKRNLIPTQCHSKQCNKNTNFFSSTRIIQSRSKLERQEAISSRGMVTEIEQPINQGDEI